MSWAAAERLLSTGLAELGLPASLNEPLLDYLRLLDKWSGAYNLTAVREPAAMVTHHLLDSLAVRPWLKGPRVIDVGSGAGIPGIPLALACPELVFVLLDSNAKKTRFITQAMLELKLPNVSVARARSEDFQPAQRFDTVISRAFASLAQMVEMTQHLCAPDGLFVAMKGVHPREELSALPAQIKVEGVEPLNVPGLNAERHAVLLKFLSPLPPGEG